MKKKETKEYFDFMSSNDKIDEMDIERQKWMACTPKFRYETIIDLAKKMKAKFRSDPFIYNKIASLLMQNTYTPEDVRAMLKGSR